MQRFVSLLLVVSATTAGAFAPSSLGHTHHNHRQPAVSSAAAAADDAALTRSSSPASSKSSPEPMPTCSAAPSTLSRRGAFAKAVLPAMAALAGGSTAAFAKGAEGTKDDSKYQACLGKCIYYCTKPKGSEQKSRQECIPGCKKECATSDKQLFTPGKGDDV